MKFQNYYLKQIYLKTIDILWAVYKSSKIILGTGSCKYYPSCSEYAKQSFKYHNPLKALIKTTYRLLRCNPFSAGGYDPVIKEDKCRKIY